MAKLPHSCRKLQEAGQPASGPSHHEPRLPCVFDDLAADGFAPAGEELLDGLEHRQDLLGKGARTMRGFGIGLYPPAS